MKSILLATALFIAHLTAFAADKVVEKIETPAVDAAQIIGEDFKPIALDDAQVEQPTSEAGAAANTDTAAASETAKEAAALPAVKPIALKENEIPVLTKVEDKKAAVQNPLTRIVIGLFVMALLFFGLIKFTKFWQKKAGIKIDDNNKIRVLNQHFLGPRKSLAIIRVAGETILIGVTDQNISHIKSLSLLEDAEVPTETPSNFANTLKSAGADESAENESAWSSIRDRVSTKIKEMRPL